MSLTLRRALWPTAGALLLTALLPQQTAQAAPVVDGLFDVTGVGASHQIALDPDGNLWVALESNSADLARITPAGAVQEFDPTDVTDPVGIAAGPDGNMWVTQNQSVARFDPADPNGAQKFTVNDIQQPQAITAGPLDSMWTGSGDKVVRIPVATPNAPETFPNTGVEGARGIARGADGNVWVADFGGNQVVRVTPAGVGTEFPTGGNPQGITAHPTRQQVLYADPGTDPQTVGRIDSGGSPQPTQVPMTDPFGAAFGPDGAYWVAQFLTDNLGRITPDGQYSTVAGLPAGSGPRQLAAGPANTLWVTLDTAEKVARIVGVEPPVPPKQPGGGGAGGGGAGGGGAGGGGGSQRDDTVRITVKPVSRADSLRVRVRPDLGPKKQWVFRLQRKTAARGAGPKWRALAGRYRTQGKRHVATVDLARGRYRAKALPRFGYRGATSDPVRLRR